MRNQAVQMGVPPEAIIVVSITMLIQENGTQRPGFCQQNIANW